MTLPSILFYVLLMTTRQNGPTIRHMRIKSGFKPGEFATIARISYSTLDNIENERKNASVEVIHRIAAGLGVPPQAIVRDSNCLMGKDESLAERVSA